MVDTFTLTPPKIESYFGITQGVRKLEGSLMGMGMSAPVFSHHWLEPDATILGRSTHHLLHTKSFSQHIHHVDNTFAFDQRVPHRLPIEVCAMGDYDGKLMTCDPIMHIILASCSCLAGALFVLRWDPPGWERAWMWGLPSSAGCGQGPRHPYAKHSGVRECRVKSRIAAQCTVSSTHTAPLRKTHMENFISTNQQHSHYIFIVTTGLTPPPFQGSPLLV